MNDDLDKDRRKTKIQTLGESQIYSQTMLCEQKLCQCSSFQASPTENMKQNSWTRLTQRKNRNKNKNKTVQSR